MPFLILRNNYNQNPLLLCATFSLQRSKGKGIREKIDNSVVVVFCVLCILSLMAFVVTDSSSSVIKLAGHSLKVWTSSHTV